jgi:aconitate hydratase
MTSLDSFKCRKILKVGNKSYVHCSLAAAEKNGLRGISRLPFSLKVLLENVLRHEDGPSPGKTSRASPTGSRPRPLTVRSRFARRAC